MTMGGVLVVSTEMVMVLVTAKGMKIQMTILTMQSKPEETVYQLTTPSILGINE